MKHIQTVSDAEKSMRGMYKRATESTPVVASVLQMTSIRKIVEYTRQMDELKAEISKEMGALMGVMQGHAFMVDGKGRRLVSWVNSSDKRTVDWDGLVLEMNIPPAMVDKHTKVTLGARVFKIEDENIVE